MCNILFYRKQSRDCGLEFNSMKIIERIFFKKDFIVLVIAVGLSV